MMSEHMDHAPVQRACKDSWALLLGHWESTYVFQQPKFLPCLNASSSSSRLYVTGPCNIQSTAAVVHHVLREVSH